MLLLRCLFLDEDGPDTAIFFPAARPVTATAATTGCALVPGAKYEILL